MFDESDREFHDRRARAELDLAYRSASYPAMSAHLRLSSLHMAKLQTLRTPPRLVPAGRLFGDYAPASATVDLIGQREPLREADLVSR